jgi:hypothetical protein
MFRAFSCPSSGATTTAVAASGLPSELCDSSAVDRGRTVVKQKGMVFGFRKTATAVTRPER